ncbi:hypothetical protein BGZ98_002261, partial [Dissophora globulifera]
MIGLCVLKYLQESRTHLYISTRNFSKQLITLFIGLLVLPFAMYVGLFAIHFALLPNSGRSDSWVSPQFRMTLKGHDIQPVMADQAIQLVEWDDNLTCWQVHAADPVVDDIQMDTYIAREKNPTLPFEGYIHDGDSVRLKHCHSQVALSVNNLESIGSNKSYILEMRGIQWHREPVAETIWRVELAPQGAIPGLAEDYGLSLNSPESNDLNQDSNAAPNNSTLTSASMDVTKRWHSIKGFRLYNEKLGCYLMSHKVFRAPYSSYQEVGCIQGTRQKSNTIFIVDQNVNPQ